MASLSRSLFIFLAVHSFLIGLFPFFIPVYLYTHGFLLSQICFFIAATGVGFTLSLYVWDRVSKKLSLRYLVILSFTSEIVLLTLFFLEKNSFFIVLAGLFNGVFNCNFWIIQRLLFLETVTPQNSGEKFGNFQIFVMIVLKMGIFIGGLLLEKTDYFTLYLVSASIVAVAALVFLQKKIRTELNKNIISSVPLPVVSLVRYRDRFNSRSVFVIDGVFLYFESYFWVISLFLIVHQSYIKLGLLVIFLTLLFGIIFVIIKNSVDRAAVDKMYRTAVCLYIISWILRALFAEELDKITLLLVLALITFCTSIFRLVLNKRFFDIAKTTTAHEYIFVKSCWSQFFLALFFGFLAFFLVGSANEIKHLSTVYFLAAPASMIYFLYNRPQGQE